MFLTVKDIAREAIVKTKDLVVFGKTIFRQYEKNFTGGKKIGQSITLRNYNNVDVKKYKVGQNGKPDLQSVQETPTELKLEYKFVAPIEIQDEDLTLTIQDFSEQVLMRGLEPMIQQIEEYALSKVKKVNKYAKKLGDKAPSSLQDLANISAQCGRQKFLTTSPTYFIMDPETKAAIQGGAPETITANTRGDNGSAFESANFGKILGLVGLESTLIPEVSLVTAQTGTTTNKIVKSNAPQTANLEALTKGRNVSEGNILEFTDAVTKAVTTIVVAEDKTFDGVTSTLLVDSVDVEISAGSTFKVLNYGYNCVYQEKAFALCVVPLTAPSAKGVDSYQITDPNSGWGFRVVQTYEYPSSGLYIDCLAGAEHIQHELAFRVNSAR